MPTEQSVNVTIYRDGSRLVVPLTGSGGGIARLPRGCIKCASADDLEAWTSTLVTQTRRLDQLIPIVNIWFFICRRHARIARASRWAGLAMLVGAVALFCGPLASDAVVHGLLMRKGPMAVWVVSVSVLFGLGIYLGGPWRGPLRSWKVRGDYVWITGTRRAFRSQFAPLPRSLR